MNPHELQAATSFLLGRTWGSLNEIIESQTSAEEKIQCLAHLKDEIQQDIDKLFYSNPASPET